MSDDDRKLTYSERDRLLRERGRGGGGSAGSGRPRGARARAAEEKRARETLKVADALFTDERGGQAGKELAASVREAHGTPELAAACRAYLDALGPPTSVDLASIFLDAGEKSISLVVLDELLRQKESGDLDMGGGLKRQVRILSEDFDDDLASRAEDLLA